MMRLVLGIFLACLFCAADSQAQSNLDAAQTERRTGTQFLGRDVTILDPGMADDFYPKGPASVCVEGPPQRQCYTAPAEFGREPKIEIVELSRNRPALLFSAASGGVSGWRIHFALLRVDMKGKLENMLAEDVQISDQGQYSFLREAAISEAAIFVTATFVWGAEEDHFSPHHYTVSAYVQKKPEGLDQPSYVLLDQYVTRRKYHLETDKDVLGPEQKKILTRLRRAKKNLSGRTCRTSVRRK